MAVGWRAGKLSSRASFKQSWLALISTLVHFFLCLHDKILCCLFSNFLHSLKSMRNTCDSLFIFNMA